MARTPSMTPQECEAILGSRGRLFVTADNVHTARKWLTANGVPGMYAAGLARAAIAAIYNDASNTKLNDAKAKAVNAASELGESGESNEPAEMPAPAAAPIAAESFGTSAPVSPDAARIASIVGAVLASMPPAIDTAAIKRDILATIAAAPQAIDESRVLDILRTELPKLIPTTRVEITNAGKIAYSGEAIRHKLFPYALACVAARVPLLMVGPAGSFKTTTAEQIAECLSLAFYMQGAASGSHEYLGYKDGAGLYHTTPWRECFEHGGLFNAAELDSGSADVPLVLNNGMANGCMAFPDKALPIQRHDSFRIVADANTYGMGADRIYVGRTQLDGATVDRFAVLDWGYDEAAEMAIVTGQSTSRETVTIEPVANPDTAAWVRRVQALRQGAARERARLIVSPRASINGAKLLAAGIPQAMVEEMVIWKGADADMRRRIAAGA